MATNDNKWQQTTISDNKLRQQATTSHNTENEDKQQHTSIINQRQQMITNDHIDKHQQTGAENNG